MASPKTQKLLADAVQHHQAGRLPEAKTLYRRVLAADPNHAIALQFSGILAHQTGQHTAALDLIRKAIAINGQIPDFHYNIGAVLQALGHLDEAAAHYTKAISLKADFAEAHYELGNVLARQEKFSDAAAQYQQALALRPNFAEALTNLGRTLLAQGKLDEAVARWQQALALQPNFVVARMNIALALKQQGKLDDAIAQLRQVLSLKPEHADAYYNLCAALMERGEIEQALDVARRGLAAKETPEIKTLLAKCLSSPQVHSGKGGDLGDLGDFRDLLLRALSEPWARPAELAPACARFVVRNDAIRDGIARIVTAWPDLLQAEDLVGPSDLATIAGDSLFRASLESTPLCEVGLERFATAMRLTLLKAARAAGDSAVPEQVLTFYCALARQCFINDYVFAQSDTEIEWVRELRDNLVAAAESGAKIPALSLIAVASYVPLHTLPGASSLPDRPWPDAVKALLAQQVRAPLEEQRSRTTMPVLTAIEDGVSMQVRAQYEENPYPQWVKWAAANEPVSVDAFLRNKFPYAPIVTRGKIGDTEILVAGCGTGYHAIDTAQRFKGAQVLAVDLSLTSLAYAQRQTRAIGRHKIKYAQADITKLPSIGRTFDVIEARGVLHHLADPFAGWNGLLSILRPGGIMALGLYSELARRDIVAARDFIAQRGYQPTADDIRRCRQELFNSADGTPLKNVTMIPDFYSISECRDLLFHIQEHRHSLPEISAFIAEHDLQFLGFDLDAQARGNYARQFPGDIAMTDLAQWHQYESDNPLTFLGMYQFWVQKK